MADGSLVAIEGIDGAGKGTQTRLLLEWARGRGARVAHFAFPRYSGSFHGALCTRYLRGEFGDVGELSPFLIALPYAGDRFEAAPAIREELARCDLVILDRYVGSNIAHQGAKLPLEALGAFAAWLEELEYGVFGIPRPHLTLLLDMPVGAARALVEARGRSIEGGGSDIHERNVGYLCEVAIRYQWLGANVPGWRSVPCVGAEGLRSPEDVAAEVAAHVGGLLLGP